MRDMLIIMIPAVIVGAMVFVGVESAAHRDDASGFSGMLWGMVLGVLCASITAVAMLLVVVGRQ